MIPARRAVPMTSPFLASPSRISRSVSGNITTVPPARAVRVVAALSVTSTMLAAPLASRWVRPVMKLSLPVWSRAGFAEEEPARRRRHVGLPHQALADENRVQPVPRQAHDVVVAGNPALGHRDAVRRNAGRKRDRGL